MNIRCIILDLDKTTLNKQGELSAANKSAIEDVIKNGIEVVIASGRPYASLPEEVTGIPGICYAITSNGAAVYYIPSEKCLIRHLMKKSSVNAVLFVISELVEHKIAACEGFVDGVSHCSYEYYDTPMKYGASGQGIKYIRDTRLPEKDILGFIKNHQDKMDCIDVIVKDQSLKSQIWTELENKVEDIYITSSIDRLIEISDKKSGKHSAVRWLLNLLKISPAQAAAFGDADNDAQMLSFVGMGVAVENASERCKKCADFITEKYDEDGVAKWISEVLPKLG